jgi:hypothetical protein
MTVGVDRSDAELTLPVDYVPGVRGHGVLAVGRDADGAESLAVWKLGPTGQAGGAWVISFSEAEADTDRLRRIFGMVQGRSLVDWAIDGPLGIATKLSGLLPADVVGDFCSHPLDIPSLLREIGEHREAYAEALERHRPTTKSKIAPLQWTEEIPDDLETVRDALTPPISTGAAPVVAQALAVAGAVRRAVELWQDTEQARYRRTYLRSLGEPQPLPPRWLATLRAAANASTSTSTSTGEA